MPEVWTATCGHEDIHGSCCHQGHPDVNVLCYPLGQGCFRGPYLCPCPDRSQGLSCCLGFLLSPRVTKTGVWSVSWDHVGARHYAATGAMFIWVACDATGAMFAFNLSYELGVIGTTLREPAPCFTGPGITGPGPYWILQQVSWSYPSGESWPPLQHTRKISPTSP